MALTKYHICKLTRHMKAALQQIKGQSNMLHIVLYCPHMCMKYGTSVLTELAQQIEHHQIIQICQGNGYLTTFN